MNNSMFLEVSCNNQSEVEALAGSLAPLAQAGDLIALTGDLGAGKTTFSRAFIRAILEDEYAEVPSPTFTLVQTYEAPEFDIYHTDLYRLQEPEEVYDLGLDDDRSSSVLLVEWPDRMPDDWRQGALEISLKRTAGTEAGEDEARTIHFGGDAAVWSPRLEGLKK